MNKRLACWFLIQAVTILGIVGCKVRSNSAKLSAEKSQHNGKDLAKLHASEKAQVERLLLLNEQGFNDFRIGDMTLMELHDIADPHKLLVDEAGQLLFEGNWNDPLQHLKLYDQMTFEGSSRWQEVVDYLKQINFGAKKNAVNQLNDQLVFTQAVFADVAEGAIPNYMTNDLAQLNGLLTKLPAENGGIASIAKSFWAENPTGVVITLPAGNHQIRVIGIPSVVAVP